MSAYCWKCGTQIDEDNISNCPNCPPKHRWTKQVKLKNGQVITACESCGFVCNEANMEKPCKGPVRVGPR